MRCEICEFRCNIGEGSFGKCMMYQNKYGNIVERFPNSYLFVFPISIETQPMMHFFPNHKFLQLGSIGCNFKCKGCVSDVFVNHIDVFEKSFNKLTPQKVIQLARKNQCIGISFGINEPTMHYYSILELAKLAHDEGLLFGVSTNLYYTKEALLNLLPFLDFVNVGVKGFSDNVYLNYCKALSSKIVFRNIVMLFKHNVYFEVSIPYIKGQENEVTNTAKFLSKLSRKIVLQVMRFIPFGDAESSLEPSIKESEQLVERLKTYLDNVYLFNSPGTKHLDTVENNGFIKRQFWGPMGAHIISYKNPVDSIVGNISSVDYQEDGFLGGYRITRATEMVLGILNLLGVKKLSIIADIVSKILTDNTFLLEFHKSQDDESYCLEDYFKIVKKLADMASVDATFIIKRYLSILEEIKQKRLTIEHTLKSYYVMGTPLFALNTHRFENKLARYVGLDVIRLDKEGKPGVNISPNILIDYNPDIVFISGFLSCSEEDFYDACNKNSININAVLQKRVYKLPFGWDFGTPLWILGLMYIANKSYPDIYHFDIESYEKEFFNTSYHNKSFYELR